MRQLKISKSITDRQSASIDTYLREIGKYDPLTPDEEVALAIRIQSGDEAALQKMVNHNLRFVVSVAKQYTNSAMTLNDLINEGNLGLVKAAKKFDHTRGFKFISYAVWWIRQSIMQALAEHARLIRLPLNKVGQNNKIKKAFQELQQDFQRDPTPEELTALLGLDEDVIKAGLESIDSSYHASMDAPFGDDNDGNLYNIIQAETVNDIEETLMTKDTRDILMEQLQACLSPVEYDVVTRFFGLKEKGIDDEGKIVYYPSETLDDIGQSIDKTRERVRQIKEKAITKLKRKDKLIKTLLSGDFRKIPAKQRVTKQTQVSIKRVLVEHTKQDTTTTPSSLHTPSPDLIKNTLGLEEITILDSILSIIESHIIDGMSIDHTYVLSSRFSQPANKILQRLLQKYLPAIRHSYNVWDYTILQAFAQSGTIEDHLTDKGLTKQAFWQLIDHTYVKINAYIRKHHTQVSPETKTIS